MTSLQSASLWRGTLALGVVSCLLSQWAEYHFGILQTRQFESGMLRLALQSASLWRGTLTGCGQLLTLPMGATSSLDLMTRPFESGMPRLVLQSASL
jgi:hypothetical protein